MDDKSPLVLSGVFHCIKSLFSDAVEVYVPPVFKHLKGDVCTVDHRPRGLQEQDLIQISPRAMTDHRHLQKHDIKKLNIKHKYAVYLTEMV